MKDKKNICFVIQRYGKEIVGGAESLCMKYVWELKAFFNIDIVTSCAIDYDTWENYYQEGISEIDGIPVYRYASAHPRRNEIIGPLTEAVYNDPSNSLRMGKKWLKEVGPYCPGMIRHIKKQKKHYDAFIFVGYHYYNSTFGIPYVPQKAIFLPTAHDEPPLRNCNYFKYLFSLPRGFIFLSQDERDFVLRYFHLGQDRSNIVTGLWADTPGETVPGSGTVLQTYGIGKRYIIYTGRIDETKNCGQMFEGFTAYKEKYKNDIELVLAGKANMDIPQREDIKYVGFVSEDEKMSLLMGAAAFVMPSEHESLSISTLEAMACGTPVLAYDGSLVIKTHIQDSNAGVLYSDSADYAEKLAFLINNNQTSANMGTNGRTYVGEKYNRHDIINKLAVYINEVIERKR